MRLHPGFATVMIVCTCALAQQSRDPLPTVDDIKAMIDGAKYNDALKALNRLLPLRGAAAESLNRVDLLMMRAECLLQTRQQKPALEALDAAQKEAFAADKLDDAGPAFALALLINRSENFMYKPKTAPTLTGRQRIDILDRKARPDAFKALYPDELPEVRKKVKSVAATARNVPPILDAARDLFVLSCVEKVNTNDTVETHDLGVDLLTRAITVISAGLSSIATQADGIGTTANSIVTARIPMTDASGKGTLVDVSKKLGLDPKSTADLKAIKSTCDQINSACSLLRLELRSDGEVFRDILAKSAAVKAKADVILNDDYNQIVR